MTVCGREALSTRIRDHDYVHALLLKMSMPSMVELAGHTGFDFVLIDTEHGPTGGDLLDHHIRAADSAGIGTVVRVGSLNRAEIARALDAGAVGVALPQIETAEQAHVAVSYALYPPRGLRGLATSTHAGAQGTHPLDGHLRRAQNETLVITQIETPLGLENAEEILAVEGVSAAWFGFNDLSILLSSTHPAPEKLEETLLDASQRLAAACRATGKPFFVITDGPGAPAHWIDAGATGLITTLLGVTQASFSEALQVAREAEVQAKQKQSAGGALP